MIDSLLSHIAPHYCSGCGKQGTLLCDNCKYNITSEIFAGCIVCGGINTRHGALCRACHEPYVRGWCVGERVDVLKSLIDGYKFQNMKAAYCVLGELLSVQLGQLPSSTIIVPVPTVPSHIRERGYDHTLLIARFIAKKYHLQLNHSLYRVTRTKQREASRRDRFKQASVAFSSKPLPSSGPYLLIDDVITTGATLRYGAKALQDAGAEEIWAAVIARQPLD